MCLKQKSISILKNDNLPEWIRYSILKVKFLFWNHQFKLNKVILCDHNSYFKALWVLGARRSSAIKTNLPLIHAVDCILFYVMVCSVSCFGIIAAQGNEELSSKSWQENQRERVECKQPVVGSRHGDVYSFNFLWPHPATKLSHLLQTVNIIISFIVSPSL